MALKPSSQTSTSKMNPKTAASVRITAISSWNLRSRGQLGPCRIKLQVGLERLGAGFGNRLVLLAQATAYTDSSDNLTASFQGNAAGEDHHASAIRGVNAKELVAGLALLG